MDANYYQELKSKNIITEGMIPKLDNAFKAKYEGVNAVVIGQAEDLLNLINTKENVGTYIHN